MDFSSACRRRRWVGASVVGAVAAALLAPQAGAVPAEVAPHTDRTEGNGSAFARTFEAADAEHGAMFRWWWPSAVEPGRAVEQLREVAEAGYKGVEIAFVMDGTDYVVDADEHEYGDAEWRASVRAVLAEAERLGVQVDLTLGGRWPAAVPGLDVGSGAASQELTTGTAVVPAGTTYDDAVPAPTPLTYEDRTMEDGEVVTETKTSEPTYLRATATRCVDACQSGEPVLDLTTVVDISDGVSDGHVAWTPPDDAPWIVTGYWKRGTAQRNDAPFGNTTSPLSDPESRVVDHFGAAGAEAFLEFFDGLLDTETRALLRENGGSIFEDSLELKHTQAWTPGFIEAFEDTNGYSVLPYLPALARVPATSPFAEPGPRYGFAPGQDEVVERVTHDVEQTLSDLYVEHHLTPIREWANDLGLQFRAQPYGEPIDLGTAAAELDISECETLGCSEQQFRALAGGVAAARKNLLSSEMLPGGFGNLYGLTPAEIAAGANREYAFGANQMVFHGLPYPELPPSADGSITDGSVYWPGFHAFASNIGGAFGPRQPSWTLEPDMADYYARSQQVLQAGRAQYDVAVLDRGGNFLDEAGYSYAYLTGGSLAGLPVQDGRLAPDRGSFGALVVGDEPIDLDTAREIARVAEAGLPVVLIGHGPQRASGYAADAEAAAELDEQLAAVVDRVLESPNGYAAADRAAAVDAIAENVQPAATDLSSGVKSVRRADGGAVFHGLFNRRDEDVTTTVALRAPYGAVPFLLDPWSGEVSAVGTWTRDGDRVEFETDVAAGGSALIALADRRFGRGSPVGEHVVDTTADAAEVVSPGRVQVTATEPGDYTTELSGGRVVRTRVEAVPEAVALDDWDLRLDEYLPGGDGDPSYVTSHQERTIDDVALGSWTDIPAIEDAVGVGTYSTTVDVPKRLAKAGAVLDLGEVAGAYRVSVNGKRLSTTDQLGAEIDLGERLRQGKNTVEVVVASTLLNRLRVTRPDEFGDRDRKVTGLLGPVVIDPYVVRTGR